MAIEDLFLEGGWGAAALHLPFVCCPKPLLGLGFGAFVCGGSGSRGHVP